MKYKILLILFMLISVIFCLGITYSIFHSDSNLSSANQGIAKFIFNTEQTNQINIPLIGLTPGTIKEYQFSVSNNYSGSLSDVTVEYQMTIKTYHFIPLVINVYKIVDGTEELVFTCNESYTRNSQNELICNSNVQNMDYSSLIIDNYKLKVEFPSEYNGEGYSDLVDYINIEINSWQKIND